MIYLYKRLAVGICTRYGDARSRVTSATKPFLSATLPSDSAAASAAEANKRGSVCKGGVGPGPGRANASHQRNNWGISCDDADGRPLRGRKRRREQGSHTSTFPLSPGWHEQIHFPRSKFPYRDKWPGCRVRQHPAAKETHSGMGTGLGSSQRCQVFFFLHQVPLPIGTIQQSEQRLAS